MPTKKMTVQVNLSKIIMGFLRLGFIAIDFCIALVPLKKGK